MKKTLTFFIFLFSFFHVNAQRGTIDSLIKVVNSLPDSSKMKAYSSLGHHFINISLDSSTMYLFKSLELAKKLNDRDIEARCYSLLGVAEKNRGNYEKAVAYHLASLKLNEARNDMRAIAISYNDLGVLYKNMKQLDKALEYYIKSNEYCRKINLTKGISMTYNNIGTIMKEQKKPDSALHYFSLALNVAETTGDTYSISTCLANIGEVYLEKKNFNSALLISKRCLEYDKKNEDKDGMVNSYIEIAQTLDSLKSYPLAKKYGDSALRLSTQEKLMSVMPEILHVLADISKKTGNLREALAFEERYASLKDSIISKETSKQVAELQTKYETEKKENEIASLKNQKEIDALSISQKELLLQKRKYQMIAIVGIAVLLSAIAFLLHNRQQLHQRQAREKAILDAEYKERLRIAKDVHDDLGSGLSKISLVASLAQKKVTSSLALKNEILNICAISQSLADSISNIELVSKPQDTTLELLNARIHDLGEGLSKISMTAQMAKKKSTANVDLGNDIQQIAAMSKDLIDNMRDLIWVLNPENTTLDNLVARLREYCADYLDGIDISSRLDFPEHVPAMRISRESQRNIFSTVKEAINNCIKHAQANEIAVSLKLTNDQFCISVLDNGVGLDINNMKGRGNGLRNMKQRIESVGGVFSIISSSGLGTNLNITIPLEKLDLQVQNVA